MIAMGVGDENMRHRFAAHGVEQRLDVGVIRRAGIDDGDLSAPDDVAHGTLERERAGIIRQQPAHARDDVLDHTGSKVESFVEADVVLHAFSVV
jgi:hypothetical protein